MRPHAAACCPCDRLMPWWRGGDTSHSHRKVLRALAKDPVRGTAVWGAVTLCLSWSTQEGQDWWVSESFVRRTWGDEGPRLLRDAQACELVKPGRERRDGENGWLIDDTDPDLLHIRLREEVELDREKSRATRQATPKRTVRLRDGDQCRYCGKTVDWKDRTSARRGTYDHPDPADRDVFVVCCGQCNQEKYNRTVEEWAAADGRALLDPPSVPWIGPKTAEQFGVPASSPRAHPDTPSAADAAPERPGPQPDNATPAAAPTGATTGAAERDTSPPDSQPAGPGDLAGPGASWPRVADLPASGRDGDGSAALAPDPSGSRARDGPRRRGSRGRRGRARPA